MIIAAGLLIALVAVMIVLEPVLRGASAAAPTALLPDSDDEDEIDPVQRRRDLALAALKEIEFDRATGKLSDEDYQRLLGKYTAEAALALKAADAAAADPVEHLIARARAQARGANGRRRFCTECGAALGGARRFCTACGSGIAA